MATIEERARDPKHVTMVHERRPLPFAREVGPIEGAPRGMPGGDTGGRRALAEFQLVRIRPALNPTEDEDEGFDLA